VTRLQKEIRDLKSKNKDLEKTWEKTQEFLSESLEDFSVENIISTVNKRDTNNPKRLKKKEPINEREEVRKRFAREYGRSINKRED
jgi:hypothetical protein